MERHITWFERIIPLMLKANHQKSERSLLKQFRSASVSMFCSAGSAASRDSEAISLSVSNYGSMVSRSRRKRTMASYVMLFHYTHQGVEHVKQSPDRVDTLKKMFAKHGAKIKDFYALLGQYDSTLHCRGA